MRLQVAVDMLSLEKALAMLAGVAPSVDIIECGTPLVKQVGLQVATRFKESFPERQILTDLKTMDAGELEADIAFAAGADYSTVLALAGDDTIRGSVKSANAHGKQIIADMIGVSNRVQRARELEDLGVHGLEIHCGLDQQAHHSCSLADAAELIRSVRIPVSIAGGIGPDSLRSVFELGASVAVVGAAIYGAKDPAATARQLRQEVEAFAAPASR